MPAGRRRRRKLTRVQIAWLRRSARKRERFVEEYEFPRYLWKRVRKRLPGLSRDEAMGTPMGDALAETIRA
jgi:hypothetical protein